VHDFQNFILPDGTVITRPILKQEDTSRSASRNASTRLLDSRSPSAREDFTSARYTAESNNNNSRLELTSPAYRPGSGRFERSPSVQLRDSGRVPSSRLSSRDDLRDTTGITSGRYRGSMDFQQQQQQSSIRLREESAMPQTHRTGSGRFEAVTATSSVAASASAGNRSAGDVILLRDSLSR
jgi:hypothetical protein